MSEMPPRKYLWQLVDNMDVSMLWEDTDDSPNGQTDELIPNVSLLDNTLRSEFDQPGPSESEYEI